MILNIPLEHIRELKTVVALLTFEHLKTQQLVVFLTISILHHVLFLSYIYVLVCRHLILFFHIFVYVYLCWRATVLEPVLKN